MRYKTLFRVLLKVVGVWLFVEGLAAMTGAAFQVLDYMSLGGFTWAYLGWGVSGVVELLIGTYLFFGGRWIADKAIPGNRPYCHECGYDLSTSAASQCPECGTAVGPGQVSQAGR